MNGRQTLDNELKRLKTEFHRLRHLYLEGRISQKEFVAELKKLRVRDSEGKFWTIGAQSGEWYYFNGRNWIRAEPPISGESWEEEAGPPEFFLEGQGLAEKSEDQTNEFNLMAKSFRISPEVARLEADPDSQSFPEKSEKWVVVSLPSGSSTLFFGGMGILLGILAGAVAGSTRFFLQTFNFLPLFLQEIMGKLTGGIIFAALGGLAGFIGGCGLGFFISLIFNLTASLTGGLAIKAGLEKREKKEKK